jgi:SAM-dependent methyltransferase
VKYLPVDPPRVFPVGVREVTHLKDCARVALEPDEQVTFVTGSGTEYDVVRKTWGYYATPSLNHRLPGFGLKPVLTRSGDRLYLLLVEATQEAQFHAYLQAQGMEVVCWLDQVPGSTFQVSNTQHPAPSTRHPGPCSLCNSTLHSLVFTYDAPPAGETNFPLRAGEEYYREIWQCQRCGHFTNRHQLDLRELYRILRYMHDLRNGRTGCETTPTVLDVGSGLCVFLQRMKEEGWECTALDPDPRTVVHARQHVGVRAICGNFFTAPQLSSYDLITFNKVLEHVENPAVMLQKSRQHLRPDSVVYVEVPDGEAAAVEGAGREEFFIEHAGAFSLTSLSLLASQAGFSVRCIERVQEPSSKYTLRAFLHLTAK